MGISYAVALYDAESNTISLAFIPVFFYEHSLLLHIAQDANDFTVIALYSHVTFI